MSYCAHCGTQIPSLTPPCPACGSPPSGAPVPVVRTAGSSIPVIVAAVVAGLLVMITIGGILAAIAIPNLMTAIDRAKQKRAMADLRAIGSALDDYAKEKHRYPQATSVDELKPLLVPAFRPTLPVADPWNWKYHYMCWQED